MPVFVFSIIFISFLSQNWTPTVFSGRDQGSLAEAAIRLSENHNLFSTSPAIDEFYKIYGPGLALDFPGFNYTSEGYLVTHFPLGYISWLAIFYSFFGVSGFVIANSITLFLFFICFYLVARMYLSSIFSVWAWILVISSFLFSWFFKFTLSENLALMLFWFALWEYLLFIRRRKRLYLLTAFFALIILAFSRIEALAIIPAALILLFFNYRGKKLSEKTILSNWMAVPLILSILSFAYSIKINWPFYLILAKGFINSFTSADLPDGSLYSFPFHYLYLLKVFGIYAILNYIVVSILGIIYFLKDKRFSLLIPFLISLPVWIYLLNPSISMDHPWMLRRFLFAVFPVAILYSVLFLQRFFSKKIISYTIILIFLAGNIFVSAKYLTFWENKNLLKEINEIGANFSPNDLILIDR
ncbi:MAG TPA: hypothetical protein VK255_00120, partial [Patescibacteria group bacterium]|nr:hypothetical protein [Patescibacteria group bacterium]